MGLPSDLPRHLSAVRDAAVAHAISGSPLPKNIKELVSWFEAHGKHRDDFFTLDLESIASHYFDGIEAKAQGDFLDDDVLTDADRVEIARQMIEREASIESRSLSSVLSFHIARDDGVSALFFCEVHSAGQGGPEYSFAGIYKTTEEWKKSFLRSGVFIDADIDNIPDNEILRLWRYPKPKAKRKRR